MKITTSTSPETITATFCRQILYRVGQLRRTLRARYLGGNTAVAALVRRSLAEAEALAWETSFPHLFLPLLAEEKVRLAVLTIRR